MTLDPKGLEAAARAICQSAESDDYDKLHDSSVVKALYRQQARDGIRAYLSASPGINAELVEGLRPFAAFSDALDRASPTSNPDDEDVLVMELEDADITRINFGHFRRARALLSIAEQEDGWQPIETAPNDGSRVLCWNEKWEAAESGCLYGTKWAANSLAFDKGGWKYQPTHWRPLPPPPRLATKGGE